MSPRIATQRLIRTRAIADVLSIVPSGAVNQEPVHKEHELGQRGVLYIVPTPIGNDSDISAHAVEVLRTVDLIATILRPRQTMP